MDFYSVVEYDIYYIGSLEFRARIASLSGFLSADRQEFDSQILQNKI